MIKILIVDDCDSFSKILRQALENDFDVQTATGVSEALSLIEKGKIEFICSDLYMRDGTGLDILTALKQKHCDIPFVLMSGKDNCLEIKMAKYYGAIFIPKASSNFLSQIKEVINNGCQND